MYECVYIYIYIYIYIYTCAQSFSHVRLFAPLCTAACQANLSIEFSKKKYWNELTFPPPGDLPDSGIKHVSVAFPTLAGGFFTTSTTWEAYIYIYIYICSLYTHIYIYDLHILK